MRTTKEISDRLKSTEAEISRISDIIKNDENEINKPFIYKNGCRSDSTEITHDFMLRKCIAEKGVLKWVLNSNQNERTVFRQVKIVKIKH